MDWGSVPFHTCEGGRFLYSRVSLWWVFGGGTHLTVTGQPTVPPTVNVFPPSPEELKSSDSATLVCLMDGFYPGVVQVTWQADGTPISSGVETTTPTKLNDKYAASSYLSMKKSDWERKEEVTCKVTHEGKTVEKVMDWGSVPFHTCEGGRFLYSRVSLWWVFGGGTHLTVTGQPTVPPTVNVFPPSPEELKSSDSATLVCLMDGFYPGVVQVTWQADGTPISSGVETTTPTKLNDKYAASSYLSMRKSDWEKKEEVTCKVTHEGKTVEKVVRRSDCA
ncbi:immunoglobulin lambda-1 light chain-like isoform X2 [Podarcis lilfordi]|nr:immunoglobulin lambda-1 light chain-like isoform X2 [Podarcis lilfordi]